MDHCSGMATTSPVRAVVLGVTAVAVAAGIVFAGLAPGDSRPTLGDSVLIVPATPGSTVSSGSPTAQDDGSPAPTPTPAATATSPTRAPAAVQAPAPPRQPAGGSNAGGSNDDSDDDDDDRDDGDD